MAKQGWIAVPAEIVRRLSGVLACLGSHLADWTEKVHSMSAEEKDAQAIRIMAQVCLSIDDHYDGLDGFINDAAHFSILYLEIDPEGKEKIQDKITELSGFTETEILEFTTMLLRGL